MKKVIHIVLLAVLTIMLGIGLGLGVDGAGAADGQGKIKIAAEDDGRILTWDTLATATNSGVLEKTNGITTQMIIVFTNSGTATVDLWPQHALAEVADGGVFVNAVSTAIVFNPSDSDSYTYAGNVKLNPFVRIHTEDSDITTNNVDVTLIAW